MSSPKRLGTPASIATVLLVGIILMMLFAGLSAASLFVLTGESFTATDTITNAANALGAFNGTLATIASGLTNGDTQTWVIQNFTRPGTVVNVTFAVRLNASAFSNDHIAIQYSNDSGTTWFNAQTNIIPTTTLTVYGNYSVLPSFRTNASISNFQIRILYTRVGGADGVVMQFDGAEVYITYDDIGPNVTLHTPVNNSFSTSRNISFNYTPLDEFGVRNCTLYLNGTLNASNQTPIVNGAANLINVTFGADGEWLWNVTCYDIYNYSNTSNVSFLVRIDTTPPNVTLTHPPNDTLSSSLFNEFNFTVTDLANIVNCTLYVNGTSRATVNTPTKGVNTTLSATLSNGFHLWNVSCVDENLFTGGSVTWNLTISVTEPTIITNTTTYEQGDIVGVRGINWQAGANIIINITLANGTVNITSTVANASGGINVTNWTVGFGYPVGTYNVSAYQSNDTSYNSSTQFTVTNRTVTLSTDLSTYYRGETVFVTGLRFPPLTLVTLNLSAPGAGVNLTNVTVNDTSGINYSYVLDILQPYGQHNLTVFSVLYPTIRQNISFMVLERFPVIVTNKSTYQTNETVGIIGTTFTAFTTLVFRIYDTVSGIIGPGLPVTLATNESGGFNTSYLLNNTCAGNYTVVAYRQSSPNESANTTFLIANGFNTSRYQVVSSVTGNLVTPVLADVTSSNDARQGVGLTSSILDGYLQFHFSPNIPPNATFRNVIITLEHVRTSTKVDTFQMYLVQGNTLTALGGAGCSGTPPSTEGNTTCNITTQLGTNVTLANNLSVRVNYTRSNGGGGEAEVDILDVLYEWTGDPYGCFPFGSGAYPPIITEMTTEGTVVLNAGTYRAVQCNVTVFDQTGVSDILGVNGTAYTTPSGPSSADTNVSYYKNTSCAQISAAGTEANYSCTFPLQYYAANGTWLCNITVRSGDGMAVQNASFSVDPLYAINVTDTFLSFGNLGGGQTSANVTENLTNVGNQRINVSLYGFGRFVGDNTSFTCASYNVSIGSLKYAENITADYDTKRNLSHFLTDIGMGINAQIDPVIAMNTTYWQLRLPVDVPAAGQCNGTLVFQAGMG